MSDHSQKACPLKIEITPYSFHRVLHVDRYIIVVRHVLDELLELSDVHDLSPLRPSIDPSRLMIAPGLPFESITANEVDSGPCIPPAVVATTWQIDGTA